MAVIKQWMEKDRLETLHRDRERYDHTISTKYPWIDSKHHRKQIEFQKRSYENRLLKTIGIALAIAIAALIFLEGFLSGAVFVLTLVMGGFAIHHHDQMRPDFEARADPRDEETRALEVELRKRQSDANYDRAVWLRNNGHEISYQPGDEIELDDEGADEQKLKPKRWELRPIEEDNGTEPAFILTLLKKSKAYNSDLDRMGDTDGLFWIKVERRDPDGSIEIVEDREWGQWPVSWSRDNVEALARERDYAAFGRDEYVFDE